MAFSATDLANAKLPPPPEEDTQFDVLLRPGLLADVEIIVEKIPNALNVPMQAVFDAGRQTGGLREERQRVGNRATIKPLKRSESIMVIAEGVKPGEVDRARGSDRQEERQEEQERRAAAQ